MTEAELSPEERNHLWHLVGAVWFVCSFSFVIPMFYIRPSEPFPRGTWDFFIWDGIPLSFIMPISIFLSYEIFYPKRVRKSRLFHTKRFLRRTLSMIPFCISCCGVISISEVTFSEMLGDNAIFPGIVLFNFVFVVAVLLWIRRQGSKQSD